MFIYERSRIIHFIMDDDVEILHRPIHVSKAS